jgi:hypothetical protein
MPLGEIMRAAAGLYLKGAISWPYLEGPRRDPREILEKPLNGEVIRHRKLSDALPPLTKPESSLFRIVVEWWRERHLRLLRDAAGPAPPRVTPWDWGGQAALTDEAGRHLFMGAFRFRGPDASRWMRPGGEIEPGLGFRVPRLPPEARSPLTALEVGRVLEVGLAKAVVTQNEFNHPCTEGEMVRLMVRQEVLGAERAAKAVDSMLRHKLLVSVPPYVRLTGDGLKVAEALVGRLSLAGVDHNREVERLLRRQSRGLALFEGGFGLVGSERTLLNAESTRLTEPPAMAAKEEGEGSCPVRERIRGPRH